ncbi:MAG TPA: hypothetical protein VMH26_18940 [Burkholderiales bacterium]|nr:hypothetical protein [Burkholderiales bacterium]
MIIIQAVREARTEEEIYLLLTDYLGEAQLGRELMGRSTQLTRLPLASRDDVRRRIDCLFTELSVASRGLDDGSRVVIKEAPYVFGEALLRLNRLANAGGPTTSLPRPMNVMRSSSRAIQ